jgi:hypothetical protein
MAIASKLHARFQCVWLAPGSKSGNPGHIQIAVGAGYDRLNKILEFFEIDRSLSIRLEKERWFIPISL